MSKPPKKLESQPIDQLNWVQTLDRAEQRKFLDFLKTRDEHDISRMNTNIDAVFSKEHVFIFEHQQQLLNLHLSLLGIAADQLPALRSELKRLAGAPIDTSDSRAQAVRRLSFQPPIMIDTRTLEDPLYREVRYYLNFADAMFDPTLAPMLAQLMANHIRANLSPDQLATATLVVPRNSNVLLGILTAQRLKRPSVVLRENPRIRSQQVWDGNLDTGSFPIIVHDVAVSGEQLAQARDILWAHNITCSKVFCLVDRSTSTAAQTLNDAGLELIAITAVTDADIDAR